MISEADNFRLWLDSSSSNDVRSRVDKYKLEHRRSFTETFIPGEMPEGLRRPGYGQPYGGQHHTGFEAHGSHATPGYEAYGKPPPGGGYEGYGGQPREAWGHGFGGAPPRAYEAPFEQGSSFHEAPAQRLAYLDDREMAALGGDFQKSKSMSFRGDSVMLSDKERVALEGDRLLPKGAPRGGQYGDGNGGALSLTTQFDEVDNGSPLSGFRRGAGMGSMLQQEMGSMLQQAANARQDLSGPSPRDSPQARMSVSPTSLQSLWNKEELDFLGMLM